MEIYLSTGGYKNLTTGEVVKEFIFNGIKSIELSGTKYSPNNIANLSRLKKKVKFQIHNYFPPPKRPFVLNLASMNDEIYRKSLRHIFKALESCAKLNSNYYSFHSGFLCDIKISELGKKVKKKKLKNREDSLYIFIKRVSKISEKAKKYGINLMIENNVLSKNNLLEFKENPLLMCEAGECIKVIKNLPDNVKLLVDVAHLKVSSNSLKFNPSNFFLKCKDIIGGYHLSDNNGLSDTNEKFDEHSWFWKYLNKKVKYCSIEVYNLKVEEYINLLKIAKKKLSC